MNAVMLGRRVPAVLFVAAVLICVVALSAQLAAGAHLAVIAVTAAYLVWLFAESRITMRTLTESASEERTLVPYCVTRVATCAVVLLSTPPVWSAWRVVPVVIFFSGVTLRLCAIVALGRFYSHQVVRHQNHSVVTTGPYRFVRHPAYTGMLLAHLGLVALFSSVAGAVCVATLAAVLAWRIRVEERVLLTLPGYRDYAVGRARLVPGVW